MEGTTLLVTIKAEEETYMSNAAETPYKGTMVVFPKGGRDFGSEGDFEMAVMKVSATYEYAPRTFYLTFRGNGKGVEGYSQRVSFDSMDNVKDAHELARVLKTDAWTLPLTRDGVKVPLHTVMSVWAIDEKTIRFTKKTKEHSGGIESLRYAMWSEATKDSCHFYRMNEDLSDATTLRDMRRDNDGVQYVITDEDAVQDLVNQIDKDMGFPPAGDSSILRATRPDNEAYMDMDVSGMLVTPTTLDIHCPDLIQPNYDSEPMCHRPGRIFSAPLCENINYNHIIHAEPKVLTYHALKGGLHYRALVDVVIHCAPEERKYCPLVKNAYIMLHMRRSTNTKPSAKRVHDIFDRSCGEECLHHIAHDQHQAIRQEGS